MSRTGMPFSLKLVLPLDIVRSWRGTQSGDASSKLFTMLSVSYSVVNIVEDNSGTFWAGFDSLEECSSAMAGSVVRNLVAGGARAVVVDMQGNTVAQMSQGRSGAAQGGGIAQRIRMVYGE